MNLNLLLFRAWLLRQQCKESVGFTWYPQGDPIAFWLEDETEKKWEVYYNSYNTALPEDSEDEPEIDALLPLWAVIFCPLVHGRKDKYGDLITREQALHALRIAEKLEAQRLLPAPEQQEEVSPLVRPASRFMDREGKEKR